MNMRQHTESIYLHTSIVRPTLVHSHLHVRSHADAQTCMHSVTHAHTYTLESVRIMCCKCVCVRVCVFMCVYVVYVL